MGGDVNPKRAPMPTARLVLVCDECHGVIETLDLNTASLATVAFRLRKQHAKDKHGWEENEPSG